MNKKKKKSKNPKIGIYTPYSYVFDLLPNVLTAALAPGGSQVSFSSASSQCGAYPFNDTRLATPVGSATLFPGCVDFGMAAAFRLSDVANHLSYTALYDAYRITKVDVVIEYLNNVSTSNAKGVLPTMYLYNDQDDQSPPTQLLNIQGKTGLRMIQLGNKAKTIIKHSIVPRTAPILNSPTPSLPGPSAAGISFGVNKPNQWINCESGVDTVHYALKAYITDFYAPQTADVWNAFKFNFTYHVQFRAPLKAY